MRGSGQQRVGGHCAPACRGDERRVREHWSCTVLGDHPLQTPGGRPYTRVATHSCKRTIYHIKPLPTVTSSARFASLSRGGPPVAAPYVQRPRAAHGHSCRLLSQRCRSRRCAITRSWQSAPLCSTTCAQIVSPESRDIKALLEVCINRGERASPKAPSSRATERALYLLCCAAILCEPYRNRIATDVAREPDKSH